MPFCPYCKKEIDHLVYREVWSYANVSFTATSSSSDTIEYSDMEVEDCGVEESWFECPHCRKELFSDEETAAKFLNGDVEAQLKLMGEAEKS